MNQMKNLSSIVSLLVFTLVSARLQGSASPSSADVPTYHVTASPSTTDAPTYQRTASPSSTDAPTYQSNRNTAVPSGTEGPTYQDVGNRSSPRKAIAALEQARPVIEELIANNNRLVPLFVRMGFHDCIMVCDGCIDMTNPDNFGLGIPVEALRPVVKRFATPATGLSRADLWAFAATVAADVAPHGNVSSAINFTMNWYGRVDCENANDQCFNDVGARVPCAFTAGPFRPTPSVTFNTKQTFKYFAEQFNFDANDTVTIMGMHNLGHLAKNNSGITGPAGWVGTFQNTLQNLYYNALLGLGSTYPDSLKFFESFSYLRTFESNDGHPFPDRHYWSILFQNQTFIQLNTDVAIVRDLNAENTDPNSGAVSCTFNNITGSPVCPLAPTIDLAAEYALNNTFWLKSLEGVWDRMLSNGYDRIPCDEALCPLVMRR